jgi:hypothetical protein
LKHLFVVTALSVAAVLLLSSPFAQSATDLRGTPIKVSASTTPKRDRTRPYVFTTTGRVTVPSKFCAPNVAPGSGSKNCIPIKCPAGATNPSYCTRPARSVICSGKVNVRFQKRQTTISSRNVTLRADCSYRSRVTFHTLLPTRIGNLTVRARFQGNAVLKPRTSANRIVRAG